MKRKGFTLIELLAVIVILAVIALIVTPIISGVISNAKASVNLRSAEGYVEAVKTRLLDNVLDVENSLEDGIYTIDELKTKYVDINGQLPTSGEVAILNGNVVSASLVFGNNNVNVDNIGQATSNSKVYGLRWDGEDHYKRLEDAAGMNSCVGTDTISCISDFDNAEIYKEIRDIKVDGNDFVYIPKFYIKKIITGDEWEWYISKTKQDSGFYLPACFYDKENNKELPYILIGKYDASLSEDGTKLESKSGVTPLASKDINQFRNYALANNVDSKVGYQLFDIYALDVIQTLFYIEFSNINSQAIMTGYSYGHSPWDDSHKVVAVSNNKITITSGAGSKYSVNQLIDVATKIEGRNVVTNLKITEVNGDVLTLEDTPVTEHKATIAVGNIIYNVGNINGQTNEVKAHSGSIISNDNGKYSMKYRGIENIYGGYFQFVDGINIDNTSGHIYVNKNSKTYASDVMSGDYEQIGYNKLNDDGWVSKMGYDKNYPFANLPIQLDSNDSTNYADYFHQNTSETKRVLMVGGRWHDGSNNGLTYYFASNASDYCDLNVSSRLQKKVK